MSSTTRRCRDSGNRPVPSKLLQTLAARASARGDHPFLFHEGRSVGYREFARASRRAANVFVELGVEKGDRVTLAFGNSVEWLIAAFGALEAGAILHPVHPGLGAKELAYLIGHAAPRLIVVDRESAGRMARAGPTVVSFGGAEGTVPLEPLLEESPDTPTPVTLEDDDFSTLLYTSGTTGKPKGVLMTHGRTGASSTHFVEGLGVTEDDTVLFVTPLFHGNAWGAVLTALEAAATVAFPKSFHASEFWPLVHRASATVLFTLGTILAVLLTREPSERERRNPLRVILGLGSAPIRDQVSHRFGVEHVADCFGSTDAGVVTLMPRGEPPRAGSSGPPLAGVELKIVDDDGRTLSPRQAGEILVRSPNRMAAYFRDPEETSRALDGDWFRTGDLGWLDEDGWLYFVDRKRDVIRRGGENISSVMVEKALREHPAIAEVAVIGVPHPVLGQEVKAFLVRQGEVTVEEIRGFAAERLAKFQVPTLWEFRDRLPKTPTERVEKYKLRGERGPEPVLG